MKYLLDTNVVSELRKATADPAVVAWVRSQPRRDLHLSAVTVFEIDMGIRRVERRDPAQGERLRRWLDDRVLQEFRGRILPFDLASARMAASLQVPDPRPERDCLIAATAMAHGMTVATRSVRDFARIGAPHVNPWA